MGLHTLSILGEAAGALRVACYLGSKCVFSHIWRTQEPVMCSSWQTTSRKIVASPGTTWLGSRWLTQNCGRKGLVALS